MSESVGGQWMKFNGRLPPARLSDRFGERQTAVDQLRAMVADFAGADDQAELHYYLWQIGGERAARQTTIPLYEALLAQTPNYRLQQQLKRLRDF